MRSLRTASLALAGLAACGAGHHAPPAAPSTPPVAAAPAAPAAPAGAGAADAGAESAMAAIPTREVQEADFTESERSRDPFRSFESLFVQQNKVVGRLQRTVLVERYALDELKLTGIVSRGSARALLVDPTGLGWVAKVGDFIGRAELVHSGGPTGSDVAINWRVDRIRDSDVVFVREDPSHPEIPPTTRVVALRVDEGGGESGKGK
jgi:type IV pilus assembly protein PilP